LLFSRRIREHRPTLVLTILVVISLASLATGKKASFLHSWGTATLSLTAYPFLKVMNGAEGALRATGGFVFAYSEARQQADELRSQLVQATEQSARNRELLQENQRLRQMLQFMRNQPGLTLEPVKILENFKGTIMIDAGSMRGIGTSMCAVTENGIVGVVTQSDVLTSSVLTLHHADCKVGAMFKRNRVRGIVHGRSSDVSRYCTIHYIDMKDDVREGDEVVTSPESIFPTGYPIGKVVRVEKSGGVWKLAYLEPAVDVYRLDEVFVLRQAVIPAEEMAGGEPPAPEGSPSVAPQIPDTRTLQDRYAP
jgi:rod shape-determining protein MreC